jgi:DNA-binding response OmpR family regulator
MPITSFEVTSETLTGQRILVVDDEPIVREVVCAYLDREGFRVSEAATGTAAIEQINADEPHLIILDVMLPGIDGLTVLNALRRESDVPVILLSARHEESDRVLGLELGADDYVVKPFSPRELVARVRTVLKRLNKSTLDYQRFEFGSLVVDGRTRETFVDTKSIDLAPREFELLEFLCGSPRQVFSRVQLLEHVWNSSSEWQDPATVTVHVRRLRQKIEPDPEEPRWIRTVWGVGYRFEP